MMTYKKIVGAATAQIEPLANCCAAIRHLGFLSASLLSGNLADQYHAIGSVWVNVCLINAGLGLAPQSSVLPPFDAADHTPNEWLVYLGLELCQVSARAIDEASTPIETRAQITQCLLVLATLAAALGCDMQACLDIATGEIVPPKLDGSNDDEELRILDESMSDAPAKQEWGDAVRLVEFAAVQAIALREGDAEPALECWISLPDHLQVAISETEERVLAERESKS